MIKVDSDARWRARERLESFQTAGNTARHRIAEAMAISADAGARLMSSLVEAVGPGIITLANEMAGGGSIRLTTCLVQIAELIAGEPGGRLEAIVYHTKDADATIVLLRTSLGIEVSIEVDGSWNDIAHGTKWRAETIGNALGIGVPIRRK